MGELSPTDAQLLASGDPADFEALYLRHVDIVTAFVMRRVRHRENAIDAVAETFARALAARGQYVARRGPVVAWLLGIARNLLADEARRERVADGARRRLGMERISVTDEELDAVDRHVELSIDAALSQLPSEQSHAVRRRVLFDEPYIVIARQSGCSEQAARQRVHRGLQNLRTYLAEAQI